MRRVLAVLTLGVVAALPSPAAAGGLDLRIGGFVPVEKGTFFRDLRELHTVDKGDFKGIYGGVEYSFGLGENLELGLHVDGYGRTRHTSYRDFTRPSGREITQSLQLQSVPVGMTLRYVPRPGRGEVTPYFGVGADLVIWSYDAEGDFIDFESADMRVIPDHFVSDGTAPGFHVAAGLRVPVGYDFAIVGEVRYLWAKDDMGGDFRAYVGEHKLDLSGVSATLGVNVRF
jgi:Outer membrane protein beta-barrel domain